MAFCEQCGAQLNDGVKICGKCGTPVMAAAAIQYEPAPSVCAQCGTQLNEGEKFCSNCGKSREENSGNVTFQKPTEIPQTAPPEFEEVIYTRESTYIEIESYPSQQAHGTLMVTTKGVRFYAGMFYAIYSDIDEEFKQKTADLFISFSEIATIFKQKVVLAAAANRFVFNLKDGTKIYTVPFYKDAGKLQQVLERQWKHPIEKKTSDI
jgi:RNA polymerase subunit RPABC4/transcription elongation factor Spt4